MKPLLIIFLISILDIRKGSSGKLPLTNEEYALIPPVFELDDYDRCMLHGDRALFCRFSAHVKDIDENNATYMMKLIEKMSNNPNYYFHNILRRGFCLTTQCPNITENTALNWNDTNLMESIIDECYNNKLIKDYGIISRIENIDCMTNFSFHTESTLENIVRKLFLTYFLLIIFASIYEGRARYKTQEEYDRIFSSKASKFIACFSLPKSWYTLAKIDNSPDGLALSGIQGLRFMTMITVIAVHTNLANAVMPISNPQFLEQVMDLLENQVQMVLTAIIVQSFFVISGMLLGYHFFLLMDNVKELNWKLIWLALLNRYIRLTPTILATLGIVFLMYYQGNGPYWSFVVEREVNYCKANWWTNLLYINNYVNTDKMCLQHLWYLAADVQLYILHLFVLALIWKFRNYTMSILISTILLGAFITGYITYYYDYPMVLVIKHEYLINIFMDNDQWHRTYSSCLGSIGSGLIGLLYGYLYYRFRGNKDIAKSKILTALWWILIVGLTIIPVLIGTLAFQEDYKIPRILNAIFAGLHKNSYSMGMGLLLFGTTMNIGWFARSFLQWKPFQVLGRLGFCGYIIHIIQMKTKVGTTRFPSYLEPYTAVLDMLSNIVTSIFMAIALCLLVEMPTNAVQKLLVPQMASYRKKKD